MACNPDTRANVGQRRLPLLSLAIALMLQPHNAAIAQTADPLAQAFLAPPKSARAMVRWWWPGGAVTDAELAREIGVLDAAGFGGGEIQPFNPGIPNLTPDERIAVNDYATPTYFAHVAHALGAAQTHGLRLDMTFGSAWPSGGGYAITPELALPELTASTTHVTGGQAGPIKLTLPPRTRKLGAWSTLDTRYRGPEVADWPARIDARQKIVAVVAVKGTDPGLKATTPGGFHFDPWAQVLTPGQLQAGSARVLTDRLRSDGTLDWTAPPGEWQILVFKQYMADSGVSGGVGAGPQLVLDHFRKDAFAAHAHRVGDAAVAELGASFGKSLRATFVDSLELMPDLYWSEDLLAQFKRRRGYDLTPYLPLIIQPGWTEAWTAHWSPPYYRMGGSAGDMGERVREDYHRTVSDLFNENFVAPFVAWNHAHGLLARFQAHGAPSDTLRSYGLADIPETEDLESTADVDFMKLARSAGDIYGHREISAESLCFMGRPYAVTPEDLKRRADLIFTSGVNRLIIHGFPYAVHPEQWPGWHPFAPGFGTGFSTMLSENNPIWAVVPRLTTYLARTQSVLQTGDPVVPVAVFMQDFAYYQGHETEGHHEPAMLAALAHAGYDYDRINTDGLTRSRVVHGELVTPGGHHFAVVVVPRSDVLDLGAAQALAGFAAEGLKVVFVDKPPVRSEGLHDAARRDHELRNFVADIVAHGGMAMTEATLPAGLHTIGVMPNLTFDPDAATPFVERAIGKRRVFFFANVGEGDRHIGFTVPDAHGGAQLWDAWNGTIAALPVTGAAGDTHLALSLKPGASAIVVVGEDLPKSAVAAAPSVSGTAQSLVLADGWTLAASGHGANGRVIDIATHPAVPGDLRTIAALADFSGAMHYIRDVDIPAAWLAPGAKVSLDLGEVHDAALVKANGADAQPLLLAPFVIDLTTALKPGRNHIDVTVVNTPQNAMAASKGPGARFLRPKPAGLVGPVRLLYQAVAGPFP
ncbi:glycosyl hydrolase [Novosphingobium sp.]|uniref:glycosyl hydrolase n=1 Tax=Novosphingobium sp. TaxID=1874826 RepID=UPI003D11D396